jgi:D-amino-acid dehydrogenase
MSQLPDSLDDPATQKKHVAIIGGGIIGATAAVELARRGHRVTVIEPGEPGGEHAASYGNGGWLSESLVVPLSHPGIWRKVPGYLRDPIGPLSIDPRRLAHLAPWLLRFLWAGRSLRRVEATSRALQPLVARCHLLHDELAKAAGVGDLIEREGQIQVYRSREDFLKEGLAWHLRKLGGCNWAELDVAALHRREPTLHPRYRFGVELAGYNCVRPGLYVAALLRHAESLGAAWRRQRALGFRCAPGRVTAVVTDAGDIACDAVVIAAGIRSKALARSLGDRVCLEAERGYHVQLSGMEPLPRNRILLMDGRMANTPSRFGIRVTGHVQFCETDAVPDWRHADILREFTLSAYRFERMPDKVEVWMGRRPSTPDGLPILGRASRFPNAIHAFGHGHIGVASAPNTARVVADLVDDRAPAFGLSPYSPRRFRIPI